MKPKAEGKGRRKPEKEDDPKSAPPSRAPDDLGGERKREKTAGLVFLAILFSLVFWNSYWFLSKFMLIFAICYVIYLGAKSRS